MNRSLRNPRENKRICPKCGMIKARVHKTWPHGRKSKPARVYTCRNYKCRFVW